MDIIETHAHIYAKEFHDDLQEVIDKSINNKISKIYMPNIDHKSIDRMLELEFLFPHYCIPMMGLHPCSVQKDFEKELYIVEDWLKKKKFIAVGETGIDLYWDKTFLNYQKEAFKVQISLAKEHNIPIVIHCRNSFNETIEIVEEMADEHLRGVFHCFTGSKEEAERIISTGFYLGIGGVATFKNAGLDKVLPQLGLDKVVLETDSPYLAPVPFRGKRNEPSYIYNITEKLADIMKIGVAEVASVTTRNALKLFEE